MTVSMDHTRRQANYCMDYRSISALTSIIAFRSVISCAARSPVQRSVTLDTKTQEPSITISDDTFYRISLAC